MKSRSIIPLAFSILFAIPSDANPEVKVEPVAFKGQLMLLTDNSLFDPDKPDNLYFNFGGPSLRVTRGKFSTGLCFAPSMKMQFNEESIGFVPTLGFGGDVAYERLVFGLTEYYNSKTGVWNLAVGFGFRFK